MTEQTDQNEPAAKPGATLSLQAVGQLLVEAREKAGLTQDEAAARLRLMPRQVQALESGEMDALPGPAFVRGFLRNYAKLLQIDAEPLLEACRAHGPDMSQSQISLHSENILIAGRTRKAWTVYLAAALIVILVLAGWFAYMDFSGSKSEPESPAAEVEALPQVLPETEIMQQAMPVEPTPQAAVGPEPLAEQPAAAQPAAAQPAIPELPAPAAASGTAKLGMTAGQSSWVSVRDGNGKEIFRKTLPAGSTETIQGSPPFHVIIGNAAGVQVTLNDKPVDLAPHSKANVARLALE